MDKISQGVGDRARASPSLAKVYPATDAGAPLCQNLLNLQVSPRIAKILDTPLKKCLPLKIHPFCHTKCCSKIFVLDHKNFAKCISLAQCLPLEQ